mgnify:CR=1 FL=1
MKAISLPFTFDTDGRIASTQDFKKIVQDRVVLVVMTAINERVMRPNYGTNVRNAIFENVNNALSIIKQEIEVGFSNWLAYLYLINVDGYLDQDGILNITINYKYGTSANTETVTIKTATLTQSGAVITEVPYGQ